MFITLTHGGAHHGQLNPSIHPEVLVPSTLTTNHPPPRPPGILLSLKVLRKDEELAGLGITPKESTMN